MLHAERTPRELGEAIMKDLQAGRASPKSAEATEALRGWATSLLSAAAQNPALRPYAANATADQLLAVLSPETIIALTPWVKFRAARRA
jgi:hypothetical protein